jgi:hypothetical protein
LILQALACRVRDIRGQGAMISDLQGRVHLSRPSYDLAAESYPAAFVARREGGGTTRDRAPGYASESNVSITFEVAGVIPRGLESGIAAEGLLADFQRAIERADDPFMRDAALGKNLLAEELFITDVSLEPAPDGSAFEALSVGVVCVYPYRYGDPDHVA